MTRALVLSGGGPLAVAWEVGLLWGLAQAGLDLSDADYILGTSAGAIVGAHLAFGRSPEALVRGFLADAEQPQGADWAQAFPIPAVARLPALFAQAHEGIGDEGRAAVGAYARQAATPPAQVHRERMVEALAEAEWSDKALGCCVVDAESGAVRVLERDCGAPLVDAVAASTGLPGLTPPVAVDGRLYLDGGLRSSANADLATGHERVLVVSFQQPGPAGPRIAARLAEQVSRLEAGGAKVWVIACDAAVQAAIGDSTWDLRRRPAVVQAGIVQGLAAAAAAAQEVWEPPGA